MMHKFSLIVLSRLIFILMICNLLLADENQKGSVYGKITDANTNLPLENVNVYISNTLFGSSTDIYGKYEIKNIPKGTHELVVSVIGYHFLSKMIFVNTSTLLKLDFLLEPHIYITDSIAVESEIPEKWLDDLANFQNIFLGSSPFRGKCKITNPEILDFIWLDNSRMQAKAGKPLIIENMALGFRLECILEEFYWNRSRQRWSWSIKPRFIPMIPENAGQGNEWQDNRENAYMGSVYHFFKSVIQKEIQQEGFAIYRVLQAGEKVPRSDFRQSIIDYKNLLKPGIVKSETILTFENYLMVVYLKNFYSWIHLTRDEISLNEDAYPEDSHAFEVFGEWAKSGVADLLPRYFELNSNN